MALVLKDRVKETTTTTGTGTLTLAGAATNFQEFSSIGDGNTTYYVIEDTGNSAWEIGIGTYTLTGTTLSRDTVLASSTGSKLTLADGTKNVFCSYPASQSVYGDNSGLAYARIGGYTTTATASGTTALTSASTYHQYFTGTLAQTVTLPLNTTIQNGWSFHICNNSTGNLTLNSNSGALVATILPTTTVHVTCINATVNTAAAWDYGVTDFNGAVPIALGGTGQTTANTGLNALLPTQTSNANKFLKTDGTNTSWGAAGLAWQSAQSSNFTATSNNGYPVNSTAGAITVTLPASPTAGDVIVITDYAGTAGTNAITINPNGLKINATAANFYMTTNRYTAQLTYIDSTQGWLVTGGVTGAAIAAQYTATYFLLAGGGTGNSGGYAGGGGAGGYIASTFTATVGTTYTITIGGGGATLAANSGTNKGNDSTISGSGLTTITAIGGGGGGNIAPAAVNNGGSSGGGGGGANAAGSPTSGQGFTGGAGSAGGAYGAGGGGGASQAGVAGNTGAGGNGGNGIATTLTGTSVTYAGGGGGGVYQSGTRGVGGTGGGTQAGTGQAGSAAANTGSGTGGGVQAGSLGCGSGGSGVCILSVPTANYSGTGNITGTYTTGTNGSNTWIRWTLSGTYKA